MCRNIKTLAHFDPPATSEEIYAAALQYIRKIAGSAKPSKVNEAAYASATEKIAQATSELLGSTAFSGPYKNREVESEKARLRSQKRFSKSV